MVLNEVIKKPIHVAIIMDGNGRWATKQGKRRTYGHYFGAKVTEYIVKAAVEMNIKYLTLYAFSTENWKRKKSEIMFITHLLKVFIKKSEEPFLKNDIKFSVIGDISVYDKRTQDLIVNLINKTRNNKRMILTLAINYGAKMEIVNAIKKIAKDVKKGYIKPEKIDEKLFQKYLYTHDIPDVDLLIRTGFEKRLSNFLLWQSAYAELIFVDKYWPDFTEKDLKKAIEEFSQRNRRFGGV